MTTRDYVTRKEYDAWIAECAALAIACGYPVRPEMIHDSVGLVLGTDQYQAFENGMWSREPYEVFAIFEALNEPAVEGLPRDAFGWAEYGGLCDKLMLVHPGKFCSPHYHWRKTEYYEVVLGEMDVFYAPEIFEDEALGIAKADMIYHCPMPKGDPWPAHVVLPKGRQHSYERLTEYKRLRPGDSRFLVHRKHLHAFGCPRDALTPLVIREISNYSHEPTAVGKAHLLQEWQHIHDNNFVHPGLNESRLKNHIV
jgi:hypothetical protein